MASPPKKDPETKILVSEGELSCGPGLIRRACPGRGEQPRVLWGGVTFRPQLQSPHEAPLPLPHCFPSTGLPSLSPEALLCHPCPGHHAVGWGDKGVAPHMGTLCPCGSVFSLRYFSGAPGWGSLQENGQPHCLPSHQRSPQNPPRPGLGWGPVGGRAGLGCPPSTDAHTRPWHSQP